MLLMELYNSPEDDTYANTTSTSSIKEGTRKITAKQDPCWSGYHMVGTKSKDGKEVPNCVPGKKGAMNEGVNMSDIVQARELIGKALQNVQEKQKYFDFLGYLRQKYGADYSTQVHQEAAKLTKA